jgi:hypothetical protein
MGLMLLILFAATLVKPASSRPAGAITVTSAGDKTALVLCVRSTDPAQWQCVHEACQGLSRRAGRESRVGSAVWPESHDR